MLYLLSSSCSLCDPVLPTDAGPSVVVPPKTFIALILLPVDRALVSLSISLLRVHSLEKVDPKRFQSNSSHGDTKRCGSCRSFLIILYQFPCRPSLLLSRNHFQSMWSLLSCSFFRPARTGHQEQNEDNKRFFGGRKTRTTDQYLG